MRLLHEQYDADGDPVLFSCTECDYRSQSLGSLHAHVETHWSFLEWLRWHTYGWALSDRTKWMDSTEVVRVDELEEISIEDVEGL